MSVVLRPSAARGHAHHGWLEARHSFSFADYHDPAHMGFGPLRVINEDRVAPSGGFPMHPHRDMEIITYIIEGALEHKDSMGHGAVIRPGDVQVMSAGTGVRHSEFNPSPSEPVHLLQIWILPDAARHAPRYADRNFGFDGRRNRLQPVAAGDEREGALMIHQDAAVFASLLDAGVNLEHPLGPGRAAWVQVVKGKLAVNGVEAGAGDGVAAIEPSLTLASQAPDTEFLVFDLPG